MHEDLITAARAASIAGIDVSDAQLLRRALIDAAEAMGRYYVTTSRSTHSAITTLETLRRQFDQARIDHRDHLRRRSEAS